MALTVAAKVLEAAFSSFLPSFVVLASVVEAPAPGCWCCCGHACSLIEFAVSCWLISFNSAVNPDDTRMLLRRRRC